MKSISRREFVKRTVCGAGALAASGGVLSSFQLAQAKKKLKGPVNWLSWSVNHIPQLFKSFEEEYGASINPVNFEDNAEGFIKARTLGGKGLDVAQSDGIWPQKYYEAGLIEPVDPDDLEQWPCFKYMFPQFRKLKAWMTPDGKIMQVADDWSPAGIMWVKGKVPTPTSWEALWDPKYKGRIVMNDYVEKNILLAGHILGINGDPLNMSMENLQRCKKLLIDQKPLVKAYLPSSSDIVKAFVAGEADIGYCTSVGIPLRVKDSKGPECGLFIPKITHGWIEGNMLIKNAKHKEAAKAWINHFHSPEGLYWVGRKTKYPVVNTKAIQMLKDDGFGWLVDAVRMEHPEDVENMIVIGPPANMDEWVKAWNEVKAA